MKKIFGFFLVCALMACSNTPKDQSKNQTGMSGYNEPVRGVWLTNVASNAMYTSVNVKKAVKKCHDLGLNTIFVVTWNKAMTTYRSKIMKEFTGIEIDPALDPQKTGRDPLKEVIEEAKKYNIKVIAWFEFGFSSSYKQDGGILIQLKPEWASKTYSGELCTKNGFDWMNALDTEVQDFITSLVLEVIQNYGVDGIQGDDRLPAMPSEGGYNPKVIEAYKKDHFGNEPPEYYKDFEWVNWRAEKLNAYMKHLYDTIKKTDPNCIVSMAPSIYPWSKEEYLQDWPTWVNHGYVDMICPQVYRKDAARYQSTLENTIHYIIPEKRNLLFPGMLIRVGDEQPSSELFTFMMDQNRKNHIKGEVFFFYEGLDKYKDIIKKYYHN